MKSRSASHVALSFVLIVVGGLFFWWFRERPSYLLYKAHSGIGAENQTAAIAEYKRLLSDPKLTKENEVSYRKALGEIYVRAVQQGDAISAYTLVDESKPASPFLSSAKEEFEKVLKLDPDDAASHDYLGRILWLQNLQNFAIQEFEAARAKDPNNPEPLRYLSMIRLERGESAEARELALQALAISPGNDDARMALISAYATLGNDASALNEFTRLSPGYLSRPSVRSQHALALARQNYWEAARDEIAEAIRSAPQDGWVKIMYGRILLDRGFYDEAAGAFAQSIQVMPRNAWPLVWHARVQQLRGECQEPQRTGQLLTEMFPRWPMARMVAAWSHLCAGNDAKAVSELDEALRLSRDFTDAALLRADIYLEREQFDELGRAIRPMLDQKMLEADANVLLSRSFLMQGNADMAMELAETAIRFDQRNHRAMAALGEARDAAGDSVGAERALSEAAQLNSADPVVAATDAYVRGRHGDSTIADALFRDATTRLPREPYVWLMWGRLCLEQKRYSDAIQAFQTAASLRPWLVRAQLGLVEANWAMGRPERAESALADARAINSRHKDVVLWRDRIRRGA